VIHVVLACRPEPTSKPDHSPSIVESVVTLVVPPPVESTRCVPNDEIVGNGLDEAGDGFADELGIGEPAEDAATLVWLGGVDNTFGEVIRAGTDQTGTIWLAAGGIDVTMADVTPVDGLADVHIQAAEGFGHQLAVADWSAGFLVVADIVGEVVVYAGAGELHRDNDASASMFTPAFGITIGELDGTAEQELIAGGGGTLRIYDAPVGDTFAPPRLTVTSDFAVTQNFAYQVGEVGDVTGDGLPELTAYEEDDPIGGRARILPGDLTGTVLNTDIGWSLAGEEPYGQAGFAIALDDLDGDGYLDLVTGAYLAAARGGVTYVVPGPILEDGWLADGMARFSPAFPNDWCGVALDTMPDQDGDGRAELLIGCPRDEFQGVDLPGRVELYAGARVSGTVDATLADRIFVGRSPDDRFGTAALGDADVTGDGEPDLVVGAPGDTANGTHLQPLSGAVYVIPGPLL
jgi:hypothetical protein